MIIRTFIFSIFLIASSFSGTLDEITKNALNRNFEIKEIQKSIDLSEQDIILSNTWKNPMLSLGVNDIQFNNPLQRDKEAMQAQFIGLSQVIPTNGKLSKKTKIAQKDKEIAQLLLKEKKLSLISKIYEYGYSIIITQKKIDLINHYQKNTKELEEVASMLYENGKTKQIVPLNAKLLNSKLQTQKENLIFKLQSLKLKLQELTYEDIQDIEASLEKKEYKKADINNHPTILKLQKLIEKQNSIAKFQNAKNIPDVKVNFGYFQREDRADYASISVSFELPVRDIEEIEVTKANYKASMLQDRIKTIKQLFITKIQTLQKKMDKSYKNYEILLHDMGSQKDYIGQNIALHAELGHMNSIDLIQNINDSINLEIMALNELESYFSAYSQNLYFTGVTK